MKTVYRIGVAGYWLALTAGLLWPHAGHIGGLAKPWIGGTDDLAHFLAFLVLAVIVHFARMFPNRIYLAAGLLIYGLGTELAQTLSPGRTPDVPGAAANALGIAAGLGIAWAVQHVADRLRAAKAGQDSSRASHTPK